MPSSVTCLWEGGEWCRASAGVCQAGWRGQRVGGRPSSPPRWRLPLAAESCDQPTADSSPAYDHTQRASSTHVCVVEAQRKNLYLPLRWEARRKMWNLDNVNHTEYCYVTILLYVRVRLSHYNRYGNYNFSFIHACIVHTYIRYVVIHITHTLIHIYMNGACKHISKYEYVYVRLYVCMHACLFIQCTLGCPRKNKFLKC